MNVSTRARSGRSRCTAVVAAIAVFVVVGCGDDGGMADEATTTSGDSSAEATTGGIADTTGLSADSTGSQDEAGSTATMASSESDGGSSSESTASESTGAVPQLWSVRTDGQSGHVVLPTAAAMLGDAPSATSVSVWVRLSSVPRGDDLSGDGIFYVDGQAGAFGSGFYVFWSTERDAPSIAFYAPGGVGVRGEVVSPTDWTHVVAVYDSTATGEEATLYLDGVLAATGPASGRDMPAAGAVWIGRYLNDTFVTDGSFDELGLWTTALAADEVAAIYGGGAPLDLRDATGDYVSDTTLAGYWRMGDDDDVTGTQVTDALGTHHGTLVGGATFDADAP